MKRLVYLIIPTIILAACGGGGGKTNEAKLAELKKQRTELDVQIKQLESGIKKTGKAVPVSVIEVQPAQFDAYIEVQAQVTGDENINVLPRTAAPAAVVSVNVRPGQRVSKGQVLATLDASTIDQQIASLEPNIGLAKALYEKQQKLWEQQIGSQVQLLQAKATYESAVKSKTALVAQRDQFRIISPINGTVDQVNVKVGDIASAASPNGIHVVSFDKLKATANLGENYLGKVREGDKVNLVLSEIGDTLERKLTYVSKAVDPISRAFQVEVALGSNAKLHPNMSCRMQIANYRSSSAIVIPVSVLQQTADGQLVYIADGNKAKAVIVQTGKTANGQIEITSGLSAGDKVVVEGFAELDNGETLSIQ